MNTIDTGTTAYLTVSFFDKDGAAALPSAVYSSLYSLGPSTTIRAETLEASPLAVMTLTTSNVENTLVNPTNALETRRLRVRATYAIGDELVTHYDYAVRKAS